MKAAGTLTGSYSQVGSGSNIDLTSLGKLDWVQWGLGGDYKVNRKACVTPLISNFTIISLNSPGNPLNFSSAYWFDDQSSSYCSWQDGQPVSSIATNSTAVLAYSYPVLGGSGFKITVPADSRTNVLSVFVGSSSARGTFKASLNGQLSYTHSPLETEANGVYTITFAGSSPGQKLTVEWTLPFQATSGYVSLRAAALTALGANNPPFALLTSPDGDTNAAAPADILLEAAAQDFDGTVTNVAFYANSNRLGQSASAPYSYSWNNAPLGHHMLTAVATDDRGSSRASVPVEVFVYGTSGSQTSLIEFPPAVVDLTTEGVSDWVHWGLETITSINRKTGVVSQIGNFTGVGTGTVARYADNFTAFSWSDGTPTAAVPGTPTGVFIRGLSNGFSLELPADRSPRQLRLYLGAYAARGQLLAYLSDYSAEPFRTSIFDQSWNNEYGVVSIAYAAGSPGQQLIIIYRAVELLDETWGNVTLQAATLVGSSELAIAPGSGWNASGMEGGPFSPSFFSYTLTNASPSSFDWMASKSQDWVSLSPTSGTLAAGESSTVTVSINPNANGLAAGDYSDTVSFANMTSGSGNTSRTMNLRVHSSSPVPVDISNPIYTGTEFRFSFPTQIGCNYIVQAAGACSSTGWTNVTTLPGTGGTVAFTNASPPSDQVFYRVITEWQ